MTGQAQVAPFRYNTRRKSRKVGTVPYTLGATESLKLRNIGLLSSIKVFFVGSITYSSASTAANYAPYSLFKNILVELNSSSQELVNCSGWDLFLLDSVRRKVGRPDQQAGADFYAYPLSGSGASIVASLEIPIALSDGMNFETGLINLQAPELECNIHFTFLNALTDLGTNITGLTGTVHVYYDYYEVPDPTRTQLPFVQLHKILSQVKAITQTGEQEYTLPRGGKLLRLIHTVTLNGARSDSWDYRELKINEAESVQREDRRLVYMNQRQMYGYNLPTGVHVLDYQNAYAVPEESDLRDAIDTERATTIDSVTYVSDGATLGSGNNHLRSVREILQMPAIG